MSFGLNPGAFASARICPVRVITTTTPDFAFDSFTFCAMSLLGLVLQVAVDRQPDVGPVDRRRPLDLAVRDLPPGRVALVGDAAVAAGQHQFLGALDAGAGGLQAVVHREPDDGRADRAGRVVPLGGALAEDPADVQVVDAAPQAAA
ncbi:hypothetical protein GCM10025868_06780 [Angustibacter aerolatus]|uniref:Uncharacterized protein n=1 Tax=Angustibacter aerolatus TaxID=1162965 RepID=A0ABQ6JDB4_9ACTN|nr:hypothetical protein GCM10025868_06780 [Angustibacter aerolatus]